MPVLEDVVDSYLASRDAVVGYGDFQNVVEDRLKDTVLEEVADVVYNLTDSDSWTPALEQLFINELNRRIYGSDGATFALIATHPGIDAYFGFDDEYNTCNLETEVCTNSNRVLLTSYAVTAAQRKEIMNIAFNDMIFKVKASDTKVYSVYNHKLERYLIINKGEEQPVTADVIISDTLQRVFTILEAIPRDN